MDGWRLDVPFKISLDFWEEFRKVVKTVNPQAYLVGEVWREAGPWIKGDTFDGVTNYRLRDIIFDYVFSHKFWMVKILVMNCRPFWLRMEMQQIVC